jgi:hypothetical protein
MISKKKLFEKCARKLCLNPPDALLDLQDILQKIITNCIEHPGEKQFFRMKMTSKALKSRVLSREGGLEFLRAVGFCIVNNADNIPDQFQVDEDLHFLTLDEIHSPGATSRDHLEKCLRWLSTTVETSLEMFEARKSDGASTAAGITSCASNIVQILLPTGEHSEGGFMPYDTLANIRSFDCCFFNDKRLASSLCIIRCYHKSGLQPGITCSAAAAFYGCNRW